MKMILKLTPYPCTLTLKLVKNLPENVGGLVQYDKGNITMKLNIEDWEKYYIHESCHVVQAVEKYIEQQLGDEEEAYLMQHITTQISEQIMKKKKKNGRKRKNKFSKSLEQKSCDAACMQKIHERRSRAHN